jgi:Ca2+-binding RTX toxin-like protein
VSNVENITGSKNADVLTGNDADNVLDGGSGTDTLIGGDGNDTYVVDDASDVVKETSTSTSQIDEVRASRSWTLGANLEKLTLTGSSAINGTGNTLKNTLTGNSATNFLDGGSGADTLIGGDGNDTYIVDDASDLITETSTSTSQIDEVRASRSWTLGANLEKLTLTGSSAINGTGNTLANTLTGNTGDNVIDGGSDTVADVIDGGAGTDTISFASITGTTGVTFALGTYNAKTQATTQTVAKISSTSTDKVSNVENITGSKNADVLTGNDADNVINGGAGADTLTGGKGLDKLYGGSNDGVKDIFDFNAANESTSAVMDQIYDFVSGKDKIDLSSMTPSTNNKGAFLNDPATALGTTYKANSVWITKYDTSGTANDYVIVSADLDGKAGADFAVKLIGINNIVTADIVL